MMSLLTKVLIGFNASLAERCSGWLSLMLCCESLVCWCLMRQLPPSVRKERPNCMPLLERCCQIPPQSCQWTMMQLARLATGIMYTTRLTKVPTIGTSHDELLTRSLDELLIKSLSVAVWRKGFLNSGHGLV